MKGMSRFTRHDAFSSLMKICPLCHSQAIQLTLTAPDYRFGGHAQHQVWRCLHCGLGFTQPPLSSQELATAYPQDYDPHLQVSTPAGGLRHRLAATILRSYGYAQPAAIPLPAFLVRPLANIRSWVWSPPPAPSGNLLDVGCGSGAYGASLLRLGWRVDGVEPDQTAAERARQAGLQVQACTIQEAKLPNSKYDVITFWHVLEHLDDPVDALRHVLPALRTDGILLIEVPNWSGIIARLTGRYWFHLDLPRHRLHFTPASLTLALRQAGYQISRLQHIPNPHGLAGAIDYRWNRQQPHRSRPTLVLGWLFGILAALLKRSDVIRIVAEVKKTGRD